MANKISSRDLQSLNSIYWRLDKFYRKFVSNDLELHYGNGSVSEQLNCAIAALDSIFQEYWV